MFIHKRSRCCSAPLCPKYVIFKFHAKSVLKRCHIILVQPEPELYRSGSKLYDQHPKIYHINIC
jgi:hypothetical protein